MRGMMNYILFNHQSKAKAFVEALAPRYRALRRIDPHYKSARFVLADNDVLTRARKLDSLWRDGIRKVFIYPHAARPSLIYAFYDPWRRTTAQFVSTSAHIEIMRRIGYKGALHAVGWSLCPLREFQPRERAHNVLFAPIHPRNSQVDRKVNQAVFEKLYPLAKHGDIYLTVRWLAPFDGNGIRCYNDPNITYVEGGLGPDWRQIDDADVVIAHQTFAWLAVARGVPTLMMGEDITPHVEYRTGQHFEARGWENYRELLMYPLDILYSDDPLSLMQSAARDDGDIADWRNRMIGEAFRAEEFVVLLESYL